VGSGDSDALESVMGLQEGLDKPYLAPNFVGIDAWLNSNTLTMPELKGRVVLVDFWTYSCINCVRTLPYITEWYRKYRDKGLVIVGVHSPEFEFEKKVDNVRAALTKHGILYPVAIDNELATWSAFDNKYWPAHYLIDKNGRVVYTHFGEGKYDVTENNIRFLLGLQGDEAKPETAPPHMLGLTPETYVGYARAERYVGTPNLEHDIDGDFKPAVFTPESHWTLSGRWKIEAQKITSQDENATIRLNFKAKKVFMVMGTEDGTSLQVAVHLNGEHMGEASGKDVHSDTVLVNGNTLYELVNLPDYGNNQLEVTAPSAGLELYAFTFGD
jgi:thiol-disulfide isomerase/thioredoxin